MSTILQLPGISKVTATEETEIIQSPSFASNSQFIGLSTYNRLSRGGIPKDKDSNSILPKSNLFYAGIEGNNFYDTTKQLIITNPGTSSQYFKSKIASFNGAQYSNSTFNFGGLTSGNVLVAAKIRGIGTQLASPSAAFAICTSSTQYAFGVGMDTSNNVGIACLSNNGSYLQAYSPGVAGEWYIVFAHASSSAFVKAWINGKPATTGQNTQPSGGVGIGDEISFGAFHRSSGFTRPFTGDIEWVSLINIPFATFTDTMASILYRTLLESPWKAVKQEPKIIYYNQSKAQIAKPINTITRDNAVVPIAKSVPYLSEMVVPRECYFYYLNNKSWVRKCGNTHIRTRNLYGYADKEISVQTGYAGIKGWATQGTGNMPEYFSSLPPTSATHNGTNTFSAIIDVKQLNPASDVAIAASTSSANTPSNYHKNFYLTTTNKFRLSVHSDVNIEADASLGIHVLTGVVGVSTVSFYVDGVFVGSGTTASTNFISVSWFPWTGNAKWPHLSVLATYGLVSKSWSALEVYAFYRHALSSLNIGKLSTYYTKKTAKTIAEDYNLPIIGFKRPLFSQPKNIASLNPEIPKPSYLVNFALLGSPEIIKGVLLTTHLKNFSAVRDVIGLKGNGSTLGYSRLDMTLSGTKLLMVFNVVLPTYAGSIQMIFERSSNSNVVAGAYSPFYLVAYSDEISSNPTASKITFAQYTANNTYGTVSFPAPSANVPHTIAIYVDLSLSGYSCIKHIYVDGVKQTLTLGLNTRAAGTYNTTTDHYFNYRGVGSLLGYAQVNMAAFFNFATDEALTQKLSANPWQIFSNTTIPTTISHALPSWRGNISDVLYKDINESYPDAYDYIKTTTANASCEIGFSEVSNPQTSKGHVLKYQLLAGTLGVTVALKASGLTIASWTHGSIQADQVFIQSLTESQVANIADYSDLSVQLTSNSVTATTSSQLVASDTATVDYFGSSVALNSDGTILVVGATNWEGTTGTDRGGVYTYDLVNSSWIPRGSVLEDATGNNSDAFGSSVAITGDGSTLVVGSASYVGLSTERGCVYTFNKSGNTWVQSGSRLLASDAANSDFFGHSVAISNDGTLLVVGARAWESTGVNSGGVYSFLRTGTSWTQRGTVLTASDVADNDNFGSSVALSSDGLTMAVGSPYKDGAGADMGKVYIYSWTGSAWSNTSTITASDAAASDFFGFSVSLSGDGNTLLVGASRWENTGTNRGGVYKFSWNGSSWTQVGSVIEAADAADSDYFGTSVALSKDASTYAIGATQWEESAISAQGCVYTSRTVTSSNASCGWVSLEVPSESNGLLNLKFNLKSGVQDDMTLTTSTKLALLTKEGTYAPISAIME